MTDGDRLKHLTSGFQRKLTTPDTPWQRGLGRGRRGSQPDSHTRQQMQVTSTGRKHCPALLTVRCGHLLPPFRKCCLTPAPTSKPGDNPVALSTPAGASVLPEEGREKGPAFAEAAPLSGTVEFSRLTQTMAGLSAWRIAQVWAQLFLFIRSFPTDGPMSCRRLPPSRMMLLWTRVQES